MRILTTSGIADQSVYDLKMKSDYCYTSRMVEMLSAFKEGRKENRFEVWRAWLLKMQIESTKSYVLNANFKVLNLVNIRSRVWISVDRRPFNSIWTIWYDREITSNPMQFIVFSVQLIHSPVKFRFQSLELIDYRPQPLLYKTKSLALENFTMPVEIKTTLEG